MKYMKSLQTIHQYHWLTTKNIQKRSFFIFEKKVRSRFLSIYRRTSTRNYQSFWPSGFWLASQTISTTKLKKNGYSINHVDNHRCISQVVSHNFFLHLAQFQRSSNTRAKSHTHQKFIQIHSMKLKKKKRCGN